MNDQVQFLEMPDDVFTKMFEIRRDIVGQPTLMIDDLNPGEKAVVAQSDQVCFLSRIERHGWRLFHTYDSLFKKEKVVEELQVDEWLCVTKLNQGHM